jgi:hypothetical protein
VSATSTILRRELSSYFRSWTAYIVAAIALLVAGVIFQGVALGAGQRLSGQVLEQYFWTMSGVVQILALAMSFWVIAMERYQNTIVLLNTSPVRDHEIVLGKFLAAWTFLGIVLVLSLYMPILIKVTEGVNRGAADERAVLATALEKGRCYVEDRGYAKFHLFNAIVAAESSYVCRLRDNTRYEIQQQRPLTAEDSEAGIVLDAVVGLGEYGGAKGRPDHPLRLVVVKTTPHQKRGGAAGPGSNGLLLIATNLLHLPAWIIALIYRYRWTIEVFFRFFKHVLGCRHLLSHDPVGIEIQTYCAIIACMLISLWTGRKPTLRTYEMLCHYFTGLAEEDELLAHLAKLQKQDTRS